MSNPFRTFLYSAAGALLLAEAAGAGLIHPITEHISYQGSLQQAGQPYSGTVPMVFRLWPEESGGQSTPFEVALNVEVADGLFQVEIDFGSVFGSEAKWLEIEIDGQILDPRQRITAAPLALNALNASSAPLTSRWSVSGNGIHYSGGNVGIGTQAEETRRLSVDGRMSVRAENDFGAALFAQADSATGETTGVLGESKAPFGTALVGVASATSGPTRAVAGRIFSADGHAAFFRGPAGSANYFERAVGIGTQQPEATLHVNTGFDPVTLPFAVEIGDSKRLFVHPNGGLRVGGNFLSAADAPPDLGLWVNGLSAFGSPVILAELSTPGSTPLCRNADNMIASCGGENHPGPRTAVIRGTDGALIRFRGATSAVRLEEGFYRVYFDRDVSMCTYTAAVGDHASALPPVGYATVAHADPSAAGNPNSVHIRTFDAAGVQDDRGFHLVVYC